MDFLSSYRDFFRLPRCHAADKARAYLAGLLMKAPRKNMERMEEYVSDCDYQAVQQFLSDSPWSDRAVKDQIARDCANLIGGPQSALIFDESGFEKKGAMSAGVSRQWNGRLGKVDNCQVGVFAALSDGTDGALIDAQLYLPQQWCEDAQRCEKAKIPEDSRSYRSKPQMVLEMVDHILKLELKFGWVALDALYGSAPWLLRDLDQRGLQFVADVKGNTHIYEENPEVYLPRRQDGKGRKFKNRRARQSSCEVRESFFEDEELDWHRVEVRDSSKGPIELLAARKRVWLWDGKEKTPQEWWAVTIVNDTTGDTHFFLTNSPETMSLEELVRRHGVRFWIERAFQDAKTSLGMSDYQARGWVAWHHHMAMVLLAMLFQLREKRIHLREIELLSTQDIVELLNVYLPRRDTTREEVLANMQRRHRKRREAIDSAKRNAERRKRLASI